MNQIKATVLHIRDKIASYARYGRFHIVLLILRYILLLGIAYLMILPLFQMTSKSLTLWTDIKEGTTVYLPKTMTFENFAEANSV